MHPAVILAALALSASGDPLRPFLDAHCVRCHGPKTAEGGLTLHDLTAIDAKNADTWRKVYDRLHKGEMPPDGAKRPDDDAVRAALGTIAAEVRRTGRPIARADFLRAGNQVDHAALFDPKNDAQIDAKPRVWRVSGPIYRQLLSGIKVRAAMPAPLAGTGKLFDDQADALTIDEPTAAQLIRNAEAIVAGQTAFAVEGGKVKGSGGREFLALMDPDKEPTAAQVAAAVRKQFEAVLQRQPSDDELTRYAAFMRKNIADAGRTLGVRTTLAAVLLTPEVLYRMELGEAKADGRGLVRLTQRETAYALAFALTDARPDADLLAAAQKGQLRTAEQLTKQIARITGGPKYDDGRVLRFFREYFGYADALDVFKNQKDFAGHDARKLVGDTDRLVQLIVGRDKDVFRQLLTTDESFVAWEKPNPKAKKPDPKAKKNRGKPVWEAYDLDEPVDPEAQPVRLPKARRAGVLTQPAWLVATSLNADNHAIRRGKWVRERLLGGTIPDLPITVDAQLPDDPKKTLRERMEVTRQAYCWNCHAKMNPLGLTFEQYDHFGRWRDEELGKPVVTAGRVDRVGDAKVEGDHVDPLSMIRRLADSDRARQVFVRHAFRFWAGREETLGDGRSLQAIDAAFVRSGGSFKALLVALLTSDSFLYRAAGPSEGAKR